MSVPAGIHSLTAAQYHADPCEQPSLSASVAKILLSKSALHARAAHPRLNPDYVAAAEGKFDLGSTVHELLLEGIDNVEIIDAPKWTTNAAKFARDEARQAGRMPMLAGHYRNAVQMVEAVRRQVTALHLDPPMLTQGKAEQTLIWEDGGVWCRARVDWLHDDYGMVDDVKTTAASGNPQKWGRSTMFTIGADLQVAFYLRGLAAITGRTDTGWRFLVAETTTPYAVSVVGLSEGALAVANAKIDRALTAWRECIATDVWPGYTKDVFRAEAREWETDLLITDELEDLAWAQM